MADSAPKGDVHKDVAAAPEAAKAVPEQPKPPVSVEHSKPAENQAAETVAPANGVVTHDQPKEAVLEPSKAEEKKVESAPVVADPPASVATAEPVSHDAIESAPDPDEDDLDDLDDVLDEFAATKPHSELPAQPSSISTSGPGRPLPFLPSASISSPEDVNPDMPATGPPAGLASINAADPFGLSAATAAGGGLDDDDFAQQLQAGMADLLGELESSPEMQRQFEDMLRELGAAGATAPGGAAGVGAATGAATATADGVTAGVARDAAAAEGGAGAVPPLSFQESIQRTMERMQESGDAAGAAAASSGQSEADFLASMLREMESGGEGSDEDFSKMLLGMMEQLTNKDILYEPMKELDEKFPDWMEKNGSTVPEADMKRYETQQKLVREIIQKFEEPGYTDENVDSRKYIVDRMQEMQSAGSPPSDLVGDMDTAQEALGELDAGCPTQ